MPWVFIPLVFYNFPNNLKSLRRSWRFIPTPVSCTLMTSLSRSRCFLPISLIPWTCSNFLSSLSLEIDLSWSVDEDRRMFTSADLELFFSFPFPFCFSCYSDLTNLDVITTCPPDLVNLRALDCKLIKTYLILISSLSIKRLGKSDPSLFGKSIN